MNKVALLLVSHGLALGAGWLAFGGSAMTTAPGDETTTRLTKKPRSSDNEEGRRLLAEMRQGWGKIRWSTKIPSREEIQASMEKSKLNARQQQAEDLQEIRKRSQAVVLPANPAMKLAELAAGPEIRDTVAFAIAWLRADPAAALHFLESSEVLSNNSNMTRALEIWVEGAGFEQVAGLVQQASAWQEKITSTVMKETANQDPGQLDSMLEQLETTVSREGLIEAAVRQVSEERRTEVLAWIHESLKGKEAGRAVMMMAIGMDDLVAAKAFLKHAQEDLDPEAMQQLKGWGNYGDIMRSGVGLDSPMEERVEARLAGGVIGKTDSERRMNARGSIVSEDISGWMAGEYIVEAVKSGGMSAAEVWQQTTRQFPQYAGSEREHLLHAVFSKVAVYDNEGAMKLLADQGASDQTARYVTQVMDQLAYTDVERVLSLVSSLPEEMMIANLADFDRHYRSFVMREAERRGSFWTDWLLRQPAGVNKDLMLHNTARYYYEKSNEVLASELKEQIANPTVKSWPNSN